MEFPRALLLVLGYRLEVKIRKVRNPGDRIGMSFGKIETAANSVRQRFLLDLFEAGRYNGRESLRQCERDIELAVVRIELSHADILIGMPAVIIIDAHLRIPLRRREIEHCHRAIPTSSGSCEARKMACQSNVTMADAPGSNLHRRCTCIRCRISQSGCPLPCHPRYRLEDTSAATVTVIDPSSPVL